MFEIIMHKIFNFKRRQYLNMWIFRYAQKNKLDYKETKEKLKEMQQRYLTNIQFLLQIDYLVKKREDIVLNMDFYEELFKINPKEYDDLLNNKLIVYDRCEDLVKREFVKVEDKEKCFEFIKKHKKIVGKRNYGTGGEKFKIYNVNEEKIEKIYDQIVKNKNVIIEEYIEQHDVIKKIYNGSLNTVRIHTVNNGNKVKIFLKPKMRIGCNGSKIDNHSIYGSAYRLILNEDGTVKMASYIDSNFRMKKAKKHHNTNIKFEDIKIPYMKEALELVKKAAKRFPEVSCIGWDVAITKDGPTIVEGNITSGAIENYQLIHYIYNKEGIKKELEEMMNFATSSKGKRI